MHVNKLLRFEYALIAIMDEVFMVVPQVQIASFLIFVVAGDVDPNFRCTLDTQDSITISNAWNRRFSFAFSFHLQIDPIVTIPTGNRIIIESYPLS